MTVIGHPDKHWYAWQDLANGHVSYQFFEARRILAHGTAPSAKSVHELFVQMYGEPEDTGKTLADCAAKFANVVDMHGRPIVPSDHEAD